MLTALSYFRRIEPRYAYVCAVPVALPRPAGDKDVDDGTFGIKCKMIVNEQVVDDNCRCLEFGHPVVVVA
jgi:hypothetical protein